MSFNQMIYAITVFTSNLHTGRGGGGRGVCVWGGGRREGVTKKGDAVLLTSDKPLASVSCVYGSTAELDLFHTFSTI